MRKRFNKALAATLSAVMVISLAACGSSNSTTSDTTKENTTEAATENSGDTEVRGKTMKVMISEEPGEGNALKNALDKWAAESGNSYETIILSNDDQKTKFPAMAKNKDLPDLISTVGIHQLYPEEFVDMSTVVDISLFEETPLNIIGKAFTEDVYSGLPVQFTTTSFYYNEDLFAEAGIEAPTAENPWTIDQLYENAALLQEKTGVKYGFAADVSRARYDILMYANGGSLVQKDGDSFKITLNSAMNVDTLTKFVKANEDGVMPKAIWAGATTDNPVEYFKNGDAAILLSGSWNYNTFATEISSFEFGIMTSPTGTVSRSAIIGGGALAVPKNADNSDVALDFIKWLYTEENFKTYLQNDKGLSSMKNVIYEPESEKARVDFEMLQDEVKQVTDTFEVDESSSWRVYKDAEYRDTLKRAVSGELTPQEALDSFAKELSEESGWTIAE
ncbi:ABC transporter substrate-binding protein [Konateibacter massiliensis]|uniref:ABC transporter substrate-binding protein n=1 Tax=Konateibacter massiliensis TaxID=2002841 RepID=UPI000C148330|nr:sugar ABC transporter substrate-binding protein [Konateibacter massiliensis]